MISLKKISKKFDQKLTKQLEMLERTSQKIDTYYENRHKPSDFEVLQKVFRALAQIVGYITIFYWVLNLR